MKILLLSRYGRLGASSRVRSYQYLSYLKGQGVDVTVSELFGDRYISALYGKRSKPWFYVITSYLRRIKDVFHSGRYDLVWIEKELLPGIPAYLERYLSIRGIPFVVDYDDALFHRYDLNKNGLIRYLLGKKIDKVMERASLVTVGNTYLAERAIAAGARKVEIIPTVVDMERYECKKSLPIDDSFTIGWIGSPTTSPYLLSVQEALANILEDDSSIRVVAIGAAKDIDMGFPVDVLPWSEDDEVAMICRFDVGIMPLLDSSWERGKCGYKLIQYMACRKPVIASPVGVNSSIVEPGVNGYLAGSTKEWIDSLKRLRDDEKLRIDMGIAGRDKVEKEYSLSSLAPKLMGLFQQASLIK